MVELYLGLRNVTHLVEGTTSIRIVTDNDGNLAAETVAECSIIVVPMYINTSAKSYLDGVTMSRQECDEGLP